MSPYLLDVNVLIALMWPAHQSHDTVQRWFAKKSRQGWATCPFTQAGFVRIVSNPAFSTDAVTPNEALTILGSNLRLQSHTFWRDDLSFEAAVQSLLPRLVGHRQITDAYLLGLCIRKNGRLVTLDRGVSSLLVDDRDRVEWIE